MLLAYVIANLKTTALASSNDPVYDSMTLPSESLCNFMISANRDYGQILGDTTSPDAKTVISMGALYTTSQKKLPDTFSVYLGKIKLFAYSASRNRWIVLDYQPYPSGIYLYTLPWSNTKIKKCSKISYSSNYAKIDLTAKEINNCALHFWGKTAFIDKDDYLYYACAYDFWVSPNAAGKLTATNGIDIKKQNGLDGVCQLYSSRGLSAESWTKTHWGHNVPTSKYTQYNTSSLNELYVTGNIEPNLFNGYKDEIVDSSIKRVSITKFIVKNKALYIRWKQPPASITGYQIQYSTNRKFRKNVKNKYVPKSNKCSKKISRLKSNRKYFFRIRTYRKTGTTIIFSKWSKIKKIYIS